MAMHLVKQHYSASETTDQFTFYAFNKAKYNLDCINLNNSVLFTRVKMDTRQTKLCLSSHLSTATNDI